MVRPIEQRQLELGEIGDVDLELGMEASAVDEPARNRKSGVLRAGGVMTIGACRVALA